MTPMIKADCFSIESRTYDCQLWRALIPEESTQVAPAAGGEQGREIDIKRDAKAETGIEDDRDDVGAREAANQRVDDGDDLNLDAGDDAHVDAEGDAGGERDTELDDDLSTNVEAGGDGRSGTSSATQETSDASGKSGNDRGDKADDDGEENGKAKGDVEVDGNANRSDGSQAGVQERGDSGVIALLDTALLRSGGCEGQRAERRKDEEQGGDASRVLHGSQLGDGRGDKN